MHEREQPLDLLRRKRRRRLVEDQEPRLVGDGTGDLDHLPLADPQRVDRPVRIDVDAELRKSLLRPPPQRPPADDSEPLRPAAEGDVLGDGEASGIGELLEDHADAEPARRHRIEGVVSLTSDHDLALVRLVVARDDLDERRLARAVLAEQREHGSALREQVDALQDLDAAERLADAARLEPKALRSL